MITVNQMPEGWVATCSDCDWQMIQAKHTPIGHKCRATGEIVIYKPPGWENRPKLAAPALAKRLKKLGIADTAGVKFTKAVDKKEPNLARKAINFTKAAFKHVAAGKPVASDADVAARFAICQGCDLFQPVSIGAGICTHPSCGCSLKNVGLTGRNKLRWADQQCPKTPPLWKALV